MSAETASTPTPEAIAEVTISVVICAYTDARRELLDNSINAVLAQLRPGDQLVVAIDYNDELFSRVSAQFGSHVTVVSNANTQGICGARNAGIEASTGVVVAFVDDDAQIQPGWLERMRSDYADPIVAGVGGNAQPVWHATAPSLVVHSTAARRGGRGGW